MTKELILDFAQVSRGDVALVGGKNASLGEMIGALVPQGIAVPPGYAITADAFRLYLAHNHLDRVIPEHIADQVAGKSSLADTGAAVRALILEGNWPSELGRRSLRPTGQ